MNWAKGRKTKGRGTSFKGALRYVLHDKGASTARRVGFIELQNLATDDPHTAWREMMNLAEAASDLKKRAGIKATGQKLKQPVYAFTLNWHAEDRPDSDHMRKTALEALRALGMEDRQAVIVEHTDTDHRHVHIIVNLVDPQTGKTATLSNDDHKLDRWADEYEQTMGVIRSPDRRAKFAALEQGRPPPKRGQQAKSRAEAEARKATGGRAKAEAQQIRDRYADYVARLRALQDGGYQARKAENEKLWARYREERKAVFGRYDPFLAAVSASKRRRAPPRSIRDQLQAMAETAEWKELGRSLAKGKRKFNARERSMLGILASAIRLSGPAAARSGRSRLFQAFLLAVSGKLRRQALAAAEEAAKQALRTRHNEIRRQHEAMLKGARNHELAELAKTFQARQQEMQERHKAEIAEGKAAWRAVAAERDRLWSEYRKTYGLPERARQTQSGDARGLPDRFGDAASPSPPPDKPGQARPNAGWKKRRSAAERRADGSYKPRDRGAKRDGRDTPDR